MFGFILSVVNIVCNNIICSSKQYLIFRDGFKNDIYYYKMEFNGIREDLFYFRVICYYFREIFVHQYESVIE